MISLNLIMIDRVRKSCDNLDGEEEVTFEVWHVPGQRARAPCRGFPFWSQCCLPQAASSAQWGRSMYARVIR